MNEQSIFTAAIERQAAERPAFLNDACGQDRKLRERIEKLIGLHEHAGNFLERPAAVVGAILDWPANERPGTQIGPYKLLEQIGEGGMGVVYMAEQLRPIQRKVALKIIKPGMDSSQVIARFEAERQALALMDHPNIARIFDAGTTGDPLRIADCGLRIDANDERCSQSNPQSEIHNPQLPGRPYFVMELVRGIPITDFCDQQRLDARARLELFVTVCRAVQHAHQKGVIHRDLKPGNLLVELHDVKALPKVIDFGVAKAIARPLTERTLFTNFAQLIGTPLYMSPEQAQMSGLDVDTRSDVYSLGVVLYELLTGTTPFEKETLKEVGYDEMRRIIQEDEPPRPSDRLSTLRAAALSTVSANRRADPRQLRQQVRRELDWIVMKALEKDRNRRYETATGLAMDVERYLADEPVLACPPSIAYRLQKFVRRNRVQVLAAGLVVLALVGGIIGTTWGMIRAEQENKVARSREEGERRAKEETQRRLKQIEKGTKILASVFRDFDPLAAEREGVPFRVLLSRRLLEATRQLEGEAVGDPLVVAGLQHVLGISLFELGHVDQAEEVLVKASRTRQRLLGADHLDTADTKHHLAVLYRSQGQFALAETLYHEALKVRMARLGAGHADTLASQHFLAILYGSQGKYVLAEKLHNQVLEIRTATLGADHSDTLASQHRLALLYRIQGKSALAEKLHKEVLAIRMAKLGAESLDTVATKGNLAQLYYELGDYSQAEALHKEVLAVRTAKLGADHPDTLASQHYLARVYWAQGHYAQAEALHKEVLAARTAKLGADASSTLNTQHSLAELYDSQAKYTQAEALYREVLAIHTAQRGADHPATLESQFVLARHYWHRQKLELSIPLLEDTLQRRKALLDPDHPHLLQTQVMLGVNYCDAERFADAIALLEEDHQSGRDETNTAWARQALLTAYLGAGKTAEANSLVQEHVRVARQQFPADSSPLTDALADVGQLLLDARLYADAERLLREVLSFRQKTSPHFWATHQTQSLLGAALLGQEKYAAAEPLLLSGYAGLKEREATIPNVVNHYPDQALERLVQLYDAWGQPDAAARWRSELKKRQE